MKIKKATVKTTTTETKGKATTKAKAEKSEQRNGVNIGKVTGLRVMAFQDATLATNDSVKRPAPLSHIPGQRTDDELAAIWREEFPNSRAVQNGRITAEIVRGVRNLYNNGTGGHGEEGKTHQTKPWVATNGKRAQAEYTRARKPGEAKAEGAAKPKAAVDSAKAAKSSAKVVTKAATSEVKKKVVAKKRAA